jgi:hypothetical protein
VSLIAGGLYHAAKRQLDVTKWAESGTKVATGRRPGIFYALFTPEWRSNQLISILLNWI